MKFFRTLWCFNSRKSSWTILCEVPAILDWREMSSPGVWLIDFHLHYAVPRWQNSARNLTANCLSWLPAFTIYLTRFFRLRQLRSAYINNTTHHQQSSTHCINENQDVSRCQLCRYWWLRRLSLWRPAVTSMPTKLALWKFSIVS